MPSDVRRVYRPYWEWEDHQAGMYGLPFGWQAKISRARELLADPNNLERAMAALVDAWPQAAEHQMSNAEQNRRSWVGQAACCFAAEIPAIATRAAWGQLTDAERHAANACADRIIREWEEDHPEQLALFGGTDG